MDSLKLCVFSVKSSDAQLETNDRALFNLMRKPCLSSLSLSASFLGPTYLFFAIEIQLIEGVFQRYTWRGPN